MRRKKKSNVVTIESRTEYGSLTLCPYELPAVLQEFRERLDPVIKEFLEQAHPDQYNGSYLDHVIEDVASQAMSQLNQQFYQKEQEISVIRSKRLSDSAKLGEKMKEIDQRILDIDEELIVLNQEYSKCNRR